MDAQTTVNKTVSTDANATRPEKWWQFKPGNEPRNRTKFKPGHKPHLPLSPNDEFRRLRKQKVSALKKEHGPDLTASQLSYIDSAADAWARLQLQPVDAHPLAIANLKDAERHALRALVGD
jgi:hypothetical protein